MAGNVKKFKIGRTEKIVIGFLSILFVITIVHFVFYHPKSKALSLVDDDYDINLTKYNEVASKNLPPNQIKQLEGDVNSLETLLTSAIQKLDIGTEKSISPSGPLYLKMLDDIKALEKSSNKTKITVLENWTITDDIPGLEPARIPDYLDQIKQKKAILSLPNISPELKDKFDSQYLETMQRLGFNQIELTKLNPFISWLKQLKMLDYIKSHKGSLAMTDRELLTNLNIPTFSPYILNLGMFFLIRTKELLEIAIQSQVDSVTSINILEKQDVRIALKATPTPTAQIMGGEDMMMMGGRGIPSEMMGPAGARGRGEMPGLMGRLATPTPTPAEPSAAVSIPIEITVSGDNLAITKFMYGVSHSPHLMDIRDLDVNVNPQEEGKLTAKITVSCYRDIKAIDDFKKIASGTTTTAAKPAVSTTAR